MNRFYTHRTLYYTLNSLALLLMISLFVGCSSSGSDPQPASVDFAGNYKGKLVLTTKQGNQTFTQTFENLVVVVKASSKSGAYTVQLVDDQFGEISDPLTTTTSGNQITMPKQRTPGYPTNDYTGSGTLTGKTLSMTITVGYDDGHNEVNTFTGTKP